MGVSRLLAKAWIVICLFAGAHALYGALTGGATGRGDVPHIAIAVLLFMAMGLLLICGYGLSRDSFQFRVEAIFKARRLRRSLPLFNAAVFAVFVVLSFAVQVWYAPHHISGSLTDALEGAVYFAIPGHAAVTDRLSACALDGGRVFSSAFAWLLAIVFAGTAISRLKEAAGALRIDRMLHPHSLSPLGLAAALGVAGLLGVQCIFVGAPLGLLSCSAYAGLPGAVLIGLAPLLFAYLVYAALVALFASGSE